ncbi:MAG: hypothetical protein E6H05_13175 [Bacillati bacterium ANGP1]|uniref:Alkylmercury lyase n=1 Tax=Candidatus Segetimicrobium genomatis TaxID=2569760 RepID=A0A537II21_9BACT|nr:MAG: hypothetical protein E6H05_13175 [Terrabacteria group bacterium ANGP1]
MEVYPVAFREIMVSYTAVDDRVHAAVLHELLLRQTPTVEQLARVTGLPAIAVDDAMGRLRERGAVVGDPTGGVVAAYPLSGVPTSHVVALDVAVAWANCAVDALAVPAMVGRPGTISSQCTLCSGSITIDVEGTVVRSREPAGVVVAYGGLTDCRDRPALVRSCPFVNFFCGEAHAAQWQPPTTWSGRFLSLDQAARLAVSNFHHVIEVYQRFRPEQ